MVGFAYYLPSSIIYYYYFFTIRYHFFLFYYYILIINLIIHHLSSYFFSTYVRALAWIEFDARVVVLLRNQNLEQVGRHKTCAR